MRSISNNISTILSQGYGETRDVVIITLPAQVSPPSPEIILYLANGEGVVIDGQTYSNKLRSISTIKFSLNNAPDNSQITIENVSRDLGFIITDRTKVFDGAETIIKRAFRLPDGTFEAITLFVGQISDIKVDQEIINISLVSDMSKRGTNVAGRTLTQRCIFKFNVNGSGVGEDCDWQITQPGNALSCDHTLDGTNGCQSHGNQMHFGGVPAFTALSESNGYDSDTTGGWGRGPTGGWCVHPNTFILCENLENERYWLRACNVSDKDYVVSMDTFGNFIRARVIKRSKGTTTSLYNVVSSKGISVSCSPSHPFITSLDDKDGTPCFKLKVGQKTLISLPNENKYQEDIITDIEKIETFCNVIILQLDEPNHIFMGGKDKDGAFIFHNLKPADTDLGFRFEPSLGNQLI